MRPSKRFGPFSMMLSAGDGFEILPRRHRGIGRLRQLLACRALSATVFASVSSMLSRCATMRSRITGVSTLLSSKVSAAAIWSLLGRGLADEELPRLAVVVGEALRRAAAPWRPPSASAKRAEAALGNSRGPFAPGVRLVVHAADRIAHRHVAVLLEMVERAFRRVDRDVREVRAAQPLQLGVEIGEVAALQQRIVGEVDAGRHVLRHERDLLGLGEEIVGHAVEHQPADRHRRQDLFRDDLGRVEDVEVEAVGELLVEELQAAAPIPGSRRTGSRSRGRGDGSPDRRR